MSAFESSGIETGGDSFDSGADSGPFSAPINSALSASFGQSLDGIEVERGAGETNRALDAHAYTIGNKISLGDNIREDAGDAFSMEVISHEVAHALAGGGSGDKLLDSGKDDAGEAAAHAASSAFRDFVSAGGTGPAPRLKPAYGGTAMIHRFEAGEHADAVDNITTTLDEKTMDPAVVNAMKEKIKMPNGLEVTQGQLTAMMGDFYGAYDKNGKFDPMASFELMQKAPREEMAKLQAKIVTEQKSVNNVKANGGEFEGTSNADFESITNDRVLTTDPETGVTSGYSYMDLAKKNTNHFNKQDETDTDGNAGSYAVLHAAAMKAAQDAADLPAGDEKDKARQRALALEASSQHFMTDRFSAGHQFDKEQLVKENGGGDDANLRSRVMHDIYNEGGPDGDGTGVTNGKGENWQAMGDEHWADKLNQPNREKAALATAGSYGDITDIMDGKKQQADIDPMAGFHANTPVWDGDLNDKIQADAKKLEYPEMLWKEKGQALLLPAMGETWVKRQLQQSETWQDIKGVAGDAWDWTKGAASDAWDWTKGAADTVGQGASDAWDWTKQKGGEALDWGAKTAQPVIDTVSQGASDAWDWTKQKGGEALDWGAKTAQPVIDTVSQGASDAWDWTKQKGGEALDWGAKTAQPVIDTVSDGANQAWDWTKGAANTIATGAGNAWDATKDTVSGAYDTVSTGASNAWDATKDTVNGAYDTVSTGASNAWSATKGAAATAGTAISDGASWVGDQAGAAKDAFFGMFD